MAEPRDSAAFLEDVTDILQEQYFPKFEEEYERFGSTTNRLFSPDAQEVTGDGRTMQVEVAPADTVRLNNDPLGSFAAPDVLEPDKIKVRFQENSPSTNDFSEVSASCQFSDIDIVEAGKGSIVDFCDRTYRMVNSNYDEHMAILRHADRTAAIALVNGTPELNNGWALTNSTGTATNAGGLRCAVDTGSIAAFRRGTRVDFINPSTGVVNAGNIRVTDVNPSDLSVGFAYTSTGITARLSTGNLANVADNDIICFSGEYNKGLYSLGAWFSRPTAGETFLGGVDRSTADKRWLLTTATREGATSATINKSMFNDAAIAMGFRAEDEQSGLVFMTDPTIHQKLRDDIGEDAFIQIPVSDDRMKRFANFGSVGLNYQHGTFGVVKIVGDPLCPPNTVRIIAKNTWKSLYYGWKGLRPVKEGGGHWYRMNDGTPNTGRGKIWKADWYALQTDFCTKPWLNCRIMNVTAT